MLSQERSVVIDSWLVPQLSELHLMSLARELSMFYSALMALQLIHSRKSFPVGAARNVTSIHFLMLLHVRPYYPSSRQLLARRS